jgi:hypothetical protein
MKLDLFSSISREILSQIANTPHQLRSLVLAITDDEDLFSSCARYTALDKLVLKNIPDHPMQLQLYIYSDPPDRLITPSQIDIREPHNHRWNFSSLILAGGYHHTIYSTSAEDDLVPTMIREESHGCCYTLHHSQFHSILEYPNTITLILRGPLEKEHFQVSSHKSGKVKWHNSPSSKNLEEQSRKTIDLKRYHHLVTRLTDLGII